MLICRCPQNGIYFRLHRCGKRGDNVFVGIVLSYIMVGFGFATATFALNILRNNDDDKVTKNLFLFFCVGSTIWSVFFGLLIVQKEPDAAYFCRCIGMVGMFLYMITVTQLMVRWSVMDNRWTTFVKVLPFTAIFLYPFLMARENTSFSLSTFGMSYVFKQGLWNNLYTLYCVLVAGHMLVLIILFVRNKRRKWLRVMGCKLLICESVIIVGMMLDTILPMFGVGAFPGSSVSQFFGAILIGKAYLFYRSNTVTIDNISEFVYYSVESPMLIFDDGWNLRIANKSALDFFEMDGDYSEVSLDKLFDFQDEITPGQEGVYNRDAICRVNQAHCRLDMNKILDVYKEIQGYIIIVDDFSDKVRIINELEKAKKRADAANRSKSTFLAQMSHEIRTPLNTVLGMNEMILRKAEKEEILSYAGYINSAGETLLGIINDILDLSKLENGKVNLIVQDYNVKDMIHDMINLVSLKLREKKLHFKCKMDKELPKNLSGDSLRVKQIVTNILNNAVKYTEQGYVELSVFWELKNFDTVELVFKVKDTGRGIKEEDIERIFNPFERLEEQKSYSIEGNGLGLAITQELLDLMHGTLEVESVYGEGTEFCVRIPQKISNTNVESVHVRERKDKREENKTMLPAAHILIVDDMETNLLVAKYLLEDTKVKVDTARSGAECLQLVQKKKYDIIFMDHMMPEMDGIETLQEIKKETEGKNHATPIVAMTANAVVGSREMYLDAGFEDYISKPVNADMLEEIIKKHIA